VGLFFRGFMPILNLEQTARSAPRSVRSGYGILQRKKETERGAPQHNSEVIACEAKVPPLLRLSVEVC